MQQRKGADGSGNLTPRFSGSIGRNELLGARVASVCFFTEARALLYNPVELSVAYMAAV